MQIYDWLTSAIWECGEDKDRAKIGIPVSVTTLYDPDERTSIINALDTKSGCWVIKLSENLVI